MTTSDLFKQILAKCVLGATKRQLTRFAHQTTADPFGEITSEDLARTNDIISVLERDGYVRTELKQIRPPRPLCPFLSRGDGVPGWFYRTTRIVLPEVCNLSAPPVTIPVVFATAKSALEVSGSASGEIKLFAADLDAVEALLFQRMLYFFSGQIRLPILVRAQSTNHVTFEDYRLPTADPVLTWRGRHFVKDRMDGYTSRLHRYAFPHAVTVTDTSSDDSGPRLEPVVEHFVADETINDERDGKILTHLRRSLRGCVLWVPLDVTYATRTMPMVRALVATNEPSETDLTLLTGLLKSLYEDLRGQTVLARKKPILKLPPFRRKD